MGCFSICFKHRKLKKSVIPATSSPSLHRGNEKRCESVLIKVPTEESTNLGSLQTPIWESRDYSEDQLINESCDKTVTIDIDVDTNADIPIEEVKILSVESKEGKEENVNECGKLGFLVQLEDEKERDKDEMGKLGVLVQIENEKERKKEQHKDLGVHVEVENEERKMEPKEEDEEDLGVHVETENEKKIERELREENRSLGVENRAFSDSSVSSYISYPPMHRYHDCVINEDEDHDVIVQDDSSESLFSLSIDPRRQSKSSPVEVDDKEVNSPLKTACSPELNTRSIGSCPNKSDRNQNTNSLLNPIENLSQWKTLKSGPTPALDDDQEKENVYLEQEEPNIPLSKEPSFKVSDQKGKVKGENSEVTTSLSSWLIGPDKTPTVSKGGSQFSTGNSFSYSDEATSWKSIEDRPILGAWTIDEVRQVSARSSPRKSPCRNPDEMPIIGTVGSYWSHTGQLADPSNIGKSRRNREKKASSCHSTPTKTRLERGLDKGAA